MIRSFFGELNTQLIYSSVSAAKYPIKIAMLNGRLDSNNLHISKLYSTLWLL